MLFYHVMSQLTIVLTNNSDAPVTGVTVGGLVPTAVVDFTVPSAAAKSGAAAADVEAFEVTADAAYRAILVPQQATLTVTVATGDGKSRSKTLSSAQLESGKRYDMSVVVTNIDIDVELSGEVVDWATEVRSMAAARAVMRAAARAVIPGRFPTGVWTTPPRRSADGYG